MGRPADPYRRKIIQTKITNETRMQAHNTIRDIVAPAKDAFHNMGDALCNRLLILREHDPNSPLLATIAAALVRVVMHLSDCARYEEKPARAVAFAEYIRTISPENGEAHMRIGLSTPLIPAHPDGATSLKSFFHFCVYLANRSVDVNSAPAQVAHIAANNAKKRIQVLERQLSPPRKCDLFAQRFISACWTTLTCEDMKAVEKVVLTNENVELWSVTREFVTTEQVGERHEEIENGLLHAVGIAIFTRHRLTRKGNFNRAVCSKRVAAADALLRNFASVLCDAVTNDLTRIRAKIKNRKKNRRRFYQKKRKKAKSINTASTNYPHQVLGLMCFNDRIEMKWMPPAMGALSVLLHFWSKSIETIKEIQIGPFVEFYKQLKQIDVEFNRFQELSGTNIYLEKVRSILISSNETPSLKEDLYLCNLIACKHYNLFRNILLQKISLATFLKGENDGILNRAIDHLISSNLNYEKVVGPTSFRHLEAFGQQIAKKIDNSSPWNVKLNITACNYLVMLAIRKQRISRMTDMLRTYKCGIIGIEAAPRAAGGTPPLPVRDVLESQPSDSDTSQSHPLPGQLKRPRVRGSSNDCNSVERERNIKKRIRLLGNGGGSQPVPSFNTQLICTSSSGSEQCVETSHDS